METITYDPNWFVDQLDMLIEKINKYYKGVWKWIRDYEGEYAVSNEGRILSLKKTKPAILKGSLAGLGYRKIALCLDGDMEHRYIHRMVGEAFIPNPENKPCINHKDGNKTNNHVSNLEWCTDFENNQHAIENGLTHTEEARKKYGEKMKKWIAENGNPYAKKVIHIKTGKVYDSQTELAEELGIAQTTVSEHCRGNTLNQKYKFYNS